MITGSGIFKDAASDALLREVFFDAENRAFEITIPDFVIVSGPFQITALELAGRHDNEVSFDLTIESAGALTFTTI